MKIFKVNILNYNTSFNYYDMIHTFTIKAKNKNDVFEKIDRFYLFNNFLIDIKEVER